jgi:hypothetical protein
MQVSSPASLPPIQTAPFSAKIADRGDWIDGRRRAQPSPIPKNGNPQVDRKRLRGMFADSDAFATIDNAELHWLVY